MEESNEINFKAYCKFPSKKFEIRRFSISNTNIYIAIILDSIRKLFQLQDSSSFHLFWIDEEDDEIKINYQEELTEAVKAAKRNNGFVRLLITITDDNLSHVHDNILCDVCDNVVVGHRYMCTVCVNYDICMACEAKGAHSQHKMIRITKSSENLGSKESPSANKHSHRRMFAQRMNTIHRSSDIDEELVEQRRNRKCHRRGNCFDNLTCDHPRPWRRGRHGLNPCETSHQAATVSARPFTSLFKVKFMNRGEHFYGKEFRNEAAKVAEEATNFALKQATNIMKGIWTGWSGQEPQAGQPTEETSARQPPSSKKSEEKQHFTEEQLLREWDPLTYIIDEPSDRQPREEPIHVQLREEPSPNLFREEPSPCQPRGGEPLLRSLPTRHEPNRYQSEIQAGSDKDEGIDIPIDFKEVEVRAPGGMFKEIRRKMEETSISSPGEPQHRHGPIIEIESISVNPVSVPANATVVEVDIPTVDIEIPAVDVMEVASSDGSGDWSLIGGQSDDSKRNDARMDVEVSVNESNVESVENTAMSSLTSSTTDTSSQSSANWDKKSMTATVSTQVYPQLKPLYPHPDRRVRLALEHMVMMGYADDDGCLTDLLEKNNGNINRVLDELSRK